ncbi:MAG: PAS domain S-box protein [Chlorobi bacterium]|nr:PAS domain S-box protein [Chlorobiota bacterium]
MKNLKTKTKDELISVIEKLQQKNEELQKNIHSKYFSPVTDLSDDDYELLINQETDVLLKGDQNGNLILVNKFASKLTGYSQEELMQMNISDLFPESELLKKPLRFDLVLQGQSVKSNRYLKQKNGNVILVEMISKKLSDNTLICIMHDISKEEKLKTALGESERKFREIFDNAADFMMLLKLNPGAPPVINDVNLAALKALGYKKGELTGTGIDKIFSGKNKNEYLKLSKKLMTGERISFQSSHLKKDGTSFPAEISAKLIKIGNNSFIHTVSRDISEKTIAEKHIKNIEEKYRILFELLPYGAEVVNPKGIITDISPGTAKMLGYKANKLIGQHLSKIIHPDDMHLYEKKFPLLVKGKKQYAEMRLIKKDKSEIYVIRAGQPIKNEKGEVQLILTLSVDITERKKAEKLLMEKNKEIEAQNEEYQTLNEELKKTGRKLLALNEELMLAKEKAEESNKLKSAFLSNMSHEIRTPMNGILGFAQLLNFPDISREKIKEYTEIITRSGNHLLNIINDIIDISKLDAGEFRIIKTPVNINKTLRELYSFFHSYKTEKKQQHIDLKLSIPETKKDLVILTDETRLKQILSNLINNALKFTEKGYVEFGYTADKQFITFFVKDTGIGIPKNKLGEIFERFNQATVNTERLYGGTGLGLSISKACTQLLGGKIWVESEEGKGSVFKFTVPLKKAKIKKSKHTVKQNINLRGKKILIVEDDPLNFAYLSEVLKDYDVIPQHVSTAKEAINAVKKIKFDLVLMDIQLPGKDGNYAVKEIKKLFPDLPVIAQSAYAFENEKQTSIKAGCNDYITKPIKKEVLIDVLKKYIRI